MQLPNASLWLQHFIDLKGSDSLNSISLIRHLHSDTTALL